jgi:hypothetical protein
MLWSHSLAAQPAGDTLRDFGIVGHWVVGDCSLPAAPDNEHETLTVLQSGNVDWLIRLGPGLENHYVIHAAKRLNADHLSVKARLNDRIEQEMIWIIKDSKFRTISNVNMDGTYVVKEGVIVGNGRPTGWRSRCN